MIEVELHAQPLERFRSVLQADRIEEAAAFANAIRERWVARTIWNVNSTAAGGGVAELLRVLLPYVRGTGINARWLVIEGSAEFFRITKRLHHALHGSTGDGSDLGPAAHAIFEDTMRINGTEMAGMVRPRDVVILHDPQTAGLARYLIRAGALVVWRCHIGHDQLNPEVDRGWEFLCPYLENVPVFVFSRRAYIPPACDHRRTTIITPSIDPFSAKNQDLDDATVRAILVHVGLVEGPPGDGTPIFTREDGSPGRVDHHADVLRLGRAPTWDTPLITQVSRWDRLKDPVGVLRGFGNLVSAGAAGRADLLLAGPNVHAVADDPEGAEVYDEVVGTWRNLAHAVRKRIHLASLPMADLQENAAIVNAIQRHAAIVVQKSLHEGFGLTVTEAMWKARPVVASAVGGIQDQIVDEVEGLLLPDPTDLAFFARALGRLLADPALGRRLGERARERVREEFLGLRHLVQYAEVIEDLDRAVPAAGLPPGASPTTRRARS